MHFKDLTSFKWWHETFSTVGGAALWDLAKKLAGPLFKGEAGETMEEVIQENFVYAQYGLTGKLPMQVEDIYELASAEIQNELLVEGDELQKRVNTLKHKQRELFLIKAVQPQFGKGEENRRKAISETRKVLVFYARMSDEAWGKFVKTLIPHAAGTKKGEGWGATLNKTIIGDMAPVKSLGQEFLAEAERDLTGDTQREGGA
ncbi:MAG: hypothetical protein U1C57_01310 [Candidatus Doudnabacteria bacterium]|nr:hypothetical protein [bacterium]MDZ4243720.1 hypothetical protein [Candidatus Doudnabacteria bacterium]